MTSELARKMAWGAYSASVARFLEAKPRTPEFAQRLHEMNVLELAWQRTELLAEGLVADAESDLALEVVVEHLGPRVRESTLKLVLEAIDAALEQRAINDARAVALSGDLREPHWLWGRAA